MNQGVIQMRLSSFVLARTLALVAVPSLLATAALVPQPALAFNAPPDARAVCLANGALVAARSDNVANCARAAAGNYLVAVNNPVTHCTFVATIGLPGQGIPPAGEIGVAQGPANNTVRVVTRNSAGALADRPFHLVVACPD
jgi:hypothetical protein